MAGLNGKTTVAAFRDGATGEWAPARIVLHESIIDELLASKRTKKDPKICIVGGGLGVGKSTQIASTVVNDFPDAVVIDADQLWLKIPEYAALEREDWRAVGNRTYQEVRYIRDKVLAAAAARKLDIILEVMGNSELQELVQLLKRDGYKIDLRWFDCSVEEAQKRVNHRANTNPTAEDNLWCSPPDPEFPDKFEYQNVDVKTFVREYETELKKKATNMTDGSTPPSISTNQKEYLSSDWHDKLSRLITRGRKAAALNFLEHTIERSLPLFRTDPAIFESRRTAWLVRTHLLLEWNRPAEALAWTCLECQLSHESRDAKALRDRLLRQLNLDFAPAETPPDKIAVETQWPGVAGMYELKAKLERDVILSMRFPEEARRYGVPLPNGILLYGPPGCGKTFIARKIAEKLAFNFLEVKPGDLASIYVHGTQEMIKSVFTNAAAKAPTVLFFDELDAFTPKRDTAGHHYSAEVNEFLVRLSNCSEQKILVIGATNFAERLDDAVLRAGRMDLHYYVGLPDFEARAELFRQHLNGRPCARLDFNHLANCSEGYTPADIALIATQSARLALIQKTPIGLQHILKAMEEHPRTQHEVKGHTIGFKH